MNVPFPADPAPASSPIPTLTLPTGSPIPVLGFGTYKVAPEDAYDAVRRALDVGYRHIDTAQMYGNEAKVGRAIADSPVAREEIFVTSKLNNPNHEPDVARASLERSLEELQLDYLDLFLIHWPLPMHYGGDIMPTWRAMESFVREGMVRSIGVSNFEAHHLQPILDSCEVPPSINQIESHPYFANRELHRFNARHGIITEAWAPLARGVVLSDPVIVDIAREVGAQESQVVLRWAIQRGDVAFPKASSHERRAENFAITGFELDADQMRRIDELDRGEDGRMGPRPDEMDRM